MHTFVNELERPIGTYLYGRRLYEAMVAWDTITDDRPLVREYAERWRAGDKVVYSRSLESVSSARTPGRTELRPGGGPPGEVRG